MSPERFDQDDLSESELNVLLPAWKTPLAPTRLRAAVFANRSAPWWKRCWTSSIAIPLPVAVGLVMLFALGAWRWFRPPAAPTQVLIRTERVEVPVVQRETVTVYRDRAIRVRRSSSYRATSQELRPVKKLELRIIRSDHVQN